MHVMSLIQPRRGPSLSEADFVINASMKFSPCPKFFYCSEYLPHLKQLYNPHEVAAIVCHYDITVVFVEVYRRCIAQDNLRRRKAVFPLPDSFTTRLGSCAAEQRHV